MTAPPSRVEYWTKKLLGIPQRTETYESRVTQGESIAASQKTYGYVEQDPTVAGWIQDLVPTRQSTKRYLLSLVPVTQWIGNYNKVWLIGDLVAGITVGAVVVPQGMAYAKLANLRPEYGLYSSFVGVLLYFAFATSKDITIGPVAVMSLLTGQIITRVTGEYPEYKTDDGKAAIGNALAILCGAFVFVLGLLRLGFIVDFIPLPAIGAFMTGSALNIAVGQVPAMMGITGFSTRDATYKVFINILKHIGRSKLDAAMGLPALALLYIIRSACNWGARRYPLRAKTFFFLSTLRTAFVLLLFIMISWLVNRHHRKAPKFSILGTVPRGFKHMGVPKLDQKLIVAIAKELPGAIIVLLIEHIAISKSFGRVNNYVISPSQELIAIGITNLIGPFFGSYPATGSFSRTAIKSKAGVRTPLAGVITAIVVLLAIYALPPLFFYIPNPSLSAVIIHAVGDLITPPSNVYQWWKVDPPEVIIFFAGVVGSVFGTIEIGIYTTIASTAGLMLFRIAKARGEFVGKVQIIDDEKLPGEPRTVYIPLDHGDGSNPAIPIQEPLPGVFIYRVHMSPLYPSVGHYTDTLIQVIMEQTKRTNPESYPRLGDRPWNMPGPRHVDPAAILADPRPTLKAIILDFTSVDHLDVTAIQTLVDVRGQLDRHSSPDYVEWHFAGVNRPWVKRALVAGGFGTLNNKAKPMFSIAKVGDSSRALSDEKQQEIYRRRGSIRDDHLGDDGPHPEQSFAEVDSAIAKLPVYSVDRGAFHIDVHAAVSSVESRFGISKADFPPSTNDSKSFDD